MTILAAELAQEVFRRNEGILLRALEGLTADQLHRQVGPDSNPIGWLMWHLSRVQDNHFSAMEGKPHAWVSEGWDKKFGWTGEQLDRGRGHTSGQVASFRAPDVETLVGYYKSVRAHSDALLDSLADADLDKQIPALEGSDTVALKTRLQMALVDCVQHSGQIAYLRGLIGGKGWMES